MTAEHAGTDRLTFSTNGAAFFRGGLDPGELQSLERALTTLPSDQAGIRLRGIPALDPFLASTGPLGLVAASVLGPGCHPVRAILFDKTATKNWSLGWHQDRTIAVKERIEERLRCDAAIQKFDGARAGVSGRTLADGFEH